MLTISRFKIEGMANMVYIAIILAFYSMCIAGNVLKGHEVCRPSE